MLTILVIGATGNTGKTVIQTFPALLGDKPHRIIGLTRDLSSSTSHELCKVPNVKMEEKDWTSIDAVWLRERQVTRAYIASHNLPHQFYDESKLNLALLSASVQYVVRISTDPAFMGPASPVYYGRTHWAIEDQLSHPDFKNMQWTSLQPNLFIISVVTPAVDWIKNFQENGQQTPLRFTIACDTLIGLIAPEDIGAIAAHLLALDDPSAHNQQRYILSGPEEVTGEKILEAVEQYTGIKVNDVLFSDVQGIHDLVNFGYPKHTIDSILAAMDIVNSGRSSRANCPTSKELHHITPRRTFRDFLDSSIAT